jgi:hypothetical protein
MAERASFRGVRQSVRVGAGIKCSTNSSARTGDGVRRFQIKASINMVVTPYIIPV